ncbi:peptide chain release factor N(5)-glutamine methyltransferase [Pedobacter sp. PWIIR3]
MNLKDLLSHFKEELNGVYPESEVVFIFYIVVEHISGWKRAEAYSRSVEEIPAEQVAVFQQMVNQLKLNIPLQYVIGEADFYQLKFKVDASVLIPRPETEELVDWIISLQKDKQTQPTQTRILDIGTGSGCIAISLKKNLPESVVSALDVSESALEIAIANAETNHVHINFISADIRGFSSKEQFDIIVSNPPYITVREQSDMHQNVLAHEPHLALFVDDENPLEFYEAIATYALSALKPNGLLFFEINSAFGIQTVDMLNRKLFKNIVLRKDMQGADRMICCQLA